MLPPAVIVAYVLMRFYTIGYSPWGLPEAFAAAVAVGFGLIAAGVALLRGAKGSA
jgi:hypothetical protein